MVTICAAEPATGRERRQAADDPQDAQVVLTVAQHAHDLVLVGANAVHRVLQHGHVPLQRCFGARARDGHVHGVGGAGRDCRGGTRQRQAQAEARGLDAGAALTELALARLLAVQDRVLEVLPIAVVRPLDAGRQACAHTAGQRGSIARELREARDARTARGGGGAGRAGRAGGCTRCVQNLQPPMVPAARQARPRGPYTLGAVQPRHGRRNNAWIQLKPRSPTSSPKEGTTITSVRPASPLR